jgi:hypothetical protein
MNVRNRARSQRSQRSQLTVPGEVLLMFLEGKRPKALCSECHALAKDEDVALCAPLLG